MLAKRRRVVGSPAAYHVKWRNSHNVYTILAELTTVPNTPSTVTRWSASAHARVNVEVANNIDLDRAIRAAVASMAADIVLEPIPARHATTTLAFMRGQTPFHRAAVGYLIELVCWR